MINDKARWKPALLAASVSAALHGMAHAQITTAAPDGADGQVQEVVVTAQRTASLESRTPVAMSVLTGEQLRQAGLDQPSALAARLPNVHLDGAAAALKITIRGVTNADTTEKGDPSAAFMVDGVYLARPTQQNLSFYDVDRIEVLRGPQGTLYGRNTTAGAINVITNAPSRQLEGAVGVELGDYASRKVNAMLNVPVNEALALRAAMAANRHDSYLINGQGTPYTLGLDRDDVSGRLSAKLTLSPAASLLLRADHSTVHDNSDRIVPDTNFYHGIASGQPTWYDASTDQRLTNGFVPPNTRPEQGYDHKSTTGLSAELAWNLGPATVTWLGAHRRFDNHILFNYYYRVKPTFAIGVHQNFDGVNTQDSHELRVATNGSGPLSAQAGLYWFREETNTLYSFRDLTLLGLPPYYVFPTGPTLARSKAVFGQATWRVTDRLRATAGVRYTSDDKSRVGSTNFQQGPAFNPATDFRLLNAAELDTHKNTWRLGLDYDVTPTTFAYATLSTGYKAGGFNDGCLAGSSALGIPCPAAVAVPASTLYYQPETLTSREAGLKTRFWDKRASLNVAVFDYDYRNLQLSGVAIVMGAPRYVTTNAGVASVKGLEADGQVNATADDRISYGLTLLDAHYVSYTPDGVHSWAGTKLDRAPSNTITAGYEHRFLLAGGQLRAGIVARRSAAYIIGVPTQQLRYTIPARTASDATVRYQPSGAPWSVQAQVKNLENKVQPIAIDSFGMVVPSDPRTVAVRFDYRY
ncbi:MAG TPA: TonB-dependent receptor [Burkholderiaceae bacterium]|nr:TonB-dependent receptor [Burkholderiaceae bacterium]